MPSLLHFLSGSRSKIISLLHLCRRGNKWCHEEIFQRVSRVTQQPTTFWQVSHNSRNARVWHDVCIMHTAWESAIDVKKSETSIASFDLIKKRNTMFFFLKWFIFVNGLHCTNSLTISGQTSSLRPLPPVYSRHESSFLRHRWIPHRHAILWLG